MLTSCTTRLNGSEQTQCSPFVFFILLYITPSQYTVYLLLYIQYVLLKWRTRHLCLWILKNTLLCSNLLEDTLSHIAVYVGQQTLVNQTGCWINASHSCPLGHLTPRYSQAISCRMPVKVNLWPFGRVKSWATNTNKARMAKMQESTAVAWIAWR